LKRRFLLFLIILLLLVSLLGIAELTYIYLHPKLVPRNEAKVCPAQIVSIIVNPGEGLAEVAHKLKEQNVIRDERMFILLARLKGADTKIQKGEYEFMLGTPMRDVLQTMVSGRQKYYRLKVIPGSNIWQIAQDINLNRIWSGERFLSLCRDQIFIRQMGIPADSLEGYLSPDTYQFNRFDREEYIIQTMVRKFEERWKPEYEKRAQELKMTRHQIITIASIIEKETSLKEERPLVSAVIYNRLKKNMALFMDPTVIYGLMPNFDGNLTKSDLEHWTPYNTYKNRGLPPGPICNPGEDSIRAALWQANVDYLYFVSKGDGSHYFSSRYADHLKAVAQYQRGGAPMESDTAETEEGSGTIAPKEQ